MYGHALVLYVLVFVLEWNCGDGRECFSINSKEWRTFRYNATHLSPASLHWNETDHDFQVPLRVNIIETNGTSISWTAGISNYLIGPSPTHFLLRVVRVVDNFGSPKRLTRYILLEPATVNTTSTYSYNCVNVTDSSEVDFTIWALTGVKQESQNRTVQINSQRVASKTWRVSAAAKRKQRDTYRICACKASISHMKVFSMNGSLTTKAVVYNARTAFRVNFFLNRELNLNREATTVERWSDVTTANKKDTQFEKTFYSLPEGYYRLKIQKDCGKHSRCGCEAEKSKDYYYESHRYNFKTNLKILRYHMNHSDVKSNHTEPYVSVEPITQKPDILTIIGASVGVIGTIAVINVIYIVVISKKRRKRFGSTNVTSNLIAREQPELKDSVAIIYTHDSQSHRDRVYNLCGELKVQGLNVSVIDEDTHKEGMFRNWKTEGEHIFKTHGSFIFVLSPGLVDACRPPTRNPITTGSTGQDVNVADTHCGYTNMPRLILDCIKNHQSLYGYRSTSLQTVCFTDDSTFAKDTDIDISTSFAIDHISIVCTRSIPLKVNKSNIVGQRYISKLIKAIKHRKKFGVRLCTTDV